MNLARAELVSHNIILSHLSCLLNQYWQLVSHVNEEIIKCKMIDEVDDETEDTMLFYKLFDELANTELGTKLKHL